MLAKKPTAVPIHPGMVDVKRVPIGVATFVTIHDHAAPTAPDGQRRRNVDRENGDYRLNDVRVDERPHSGGGRLHGRPTLRPMSRDIDERRDRQKDDRCQLRQVGLNEGDDNVEGALYLGPYLRPVRHQFGDTDNEQRNRRNNQAGGVAVERATRTPASMPRPIDTADKAAGVLAR
jgi:hypothetical protein